MSAALMVRPWSGVVIVTAMLLRWREPLEYRRAARQNTSSKKKLRGPLGAAALAARDDSPHESHLLDRLYLARTCDAIRPHRHENYSLHGIAAHLPGR